MLQYSTYGTVYHGFVFERALRITNYDTLCNLPKLCTYVWKDFHINL
jgi:hypothetical protein